jgi:hypothetical protein
MGFFQFWLLTIELPFICILYSRLAHISYNFDSYNLPLFWCLIISCITDQFSLPVRDVKIIFLHNTRVQLLERTKSCDPLFYPFILRLSLFMLSPFSLLLSLLSGITGLISLIKKILIKITSIQINFRSYCILWILWSCLYWLKVGEIGSIGSEQSQKQLLSSSYIVTIWSFICKNTV